MYIYWLYAILSIFFSWIILKFTNSNKKTIIFYLITVLFIILYFIINYFISFIINIRYYKKINKLKCMNKNLETNLNLCNKYIYCPNNLFCNETSTGRCVNKYNTKDAFKTAINNEINNINITRNEKIKEINNILDKYYIKKKTFDDTLKIYTIYLSFIFLFYCMINFDDVNINFDLSGLNMNYIRKKIK